MTQSTPDDGLDDQSGSRPDDSAELARYVEAWWHTTGDVLALLDDVLTEAPEGGAGTVWAAPTDLPGWSVHDVVAHLAHLESVLAGDLEQPVDIGSPPHVSTPMDAYTESGVVARRNRAPSALVDELRSATTRRRDLVAADPPSDGSATPDPTFPGVPWDVRTLLRNRPLDVWMHEQDLRRALGRPGGLDSPAADHTVAYLLQGLGFVVGKKARAEPGTTVVLDVVGSAPVAVAVGDDGRARSVADLPRDPTLGLSMSRETYVLLAGGRRPDAESEVVVTGDADLARRVLDGFATTP